MSEWTRSIFAILVPNCSVCTMHRNQVSYTVHAGALRHVLPGFGTGRRRAVPAPRCSTRRITPVATGSVPAAVRAVAWSRLRPASMQITSRSSTSGNPRVILLLPLLDHLSQQEVRRQKTHAQGQQIHKKRTKARQPRHQRDRCTAEAAPPLCSRRKSSPPTRCGTPHASGAAARPKLPSRSSASGSRRIPSGPRARTSPSALTEVRRFSLCCGLMASLMRLSMTSR